MILFVTALIFLIIEAIGANINTTNKIGTSFCSAQDMTFKEIRYEGGEFKGIACQSEYFGWNVVIDLYETRTGKGTIQYDSGERIFPEAIA